MKKKTAGPKIKVFLVDDHPAVREGVRAFLTHKGVAVVGEAADDTEAVRKLRKAAPDVTTNDIDNARIFVLVLDDGLGVACCTKLAEEVAKPGGLPPPPPRLATDIWAAKELQKTAALFIDMLGPNRTKSGLRRGLNHRYFVRAYQVYLVVHKKRLMGIQVCLDEMRLAHRHVRLGILNEDDGVCSCQIIERDPLADRILIQPR